jgi:hypothetical protein
LLKMQRKNDEQRIRETVAYVHGRIERELEEYARQFLIPAVEFATRLGALLSASGQRANHSMSLRLEAAPGSATASALEGDLQPHGDGAQHPARRRTSKTRPGKVSSAQQRFWKSLSPEEKLREQIRRQSKRTDRATNPRIKSMLRTMRRKLRELQKT